MASIAQAADVSVLVTNAARRAYGTLAPQFEQLSGHRLINQFGLPPDLIRRMDAGQPFDVMILSYDVEDLVKQGKLASNSRTVFGRSGVGVAIRRGSPKPDFGTVDEFKRSLINAKTIGTSGEGSSGRFVMNLLERLGIADQVKPKIRVGGTDGLGMMLSRGEADFVVTGLPPLLGIANIEWLGYIPNEIQFWVVFSGGLSANAREPVAGRALLNFLMSPPAMQVFRENGIDPIAP